MASANLTVDVQSATLSSIAAAVKSMDRPNLLRMMVLDYDTKMVADVEGLHPITIYQKSTSGRSCIYRDNRKMQKG